MTQSFPVPSSQKVQFRFSGHESFPCRYTWLPKAFRTLSRGGTFWTDDDQAMVEMGVGKNMVRAIRFWAQATDISEINSEGNHAPTAFGKALFCTDGLDPYLEDVQTLWLMHWILATRVADPLFAWDFLISRWQLPELSPSEVLRAFDQEARRQDRNLSSATLQQHFDVFLHTYVPTRSRKGDVQEDNLDCPLVELAFLQRVGERRDQRGRMEPVYSFRRESKAEITPQLFLYCLNDFWNKRKSHEMTLTFRDVSSAHGSPGQVFKLPESDLRDRLERLRSDSDELYSYQESAALQVVTRREDKGHDLLRNIYQRELTRA